MTHPSWVALRAMAHSFIELCKPLCHDKAVIHEGVSVALSGYLGPSRLTVYSLDIIFPNLESVCCSMSSSNCCFLTCIQVSQEAGQVVWYSHLFKNFPQLVVIHTVKGFSVVNEAEEDVFLEFSCFFDDLIGVGNLISSSSAFSKSSLNIWKFSVLWASQVAQW